MDETRHTKLDNNTNTTAKIENENENIKNSEKPEKIIKKCAKTLQFVLFCTFFYT